MWINSRHATIPWLDIKHRHSLGLLGPYLIKALQKHTLHQGMCATCACCNSKNRLVAMLCPAGMWYLRASVWQLWNFGKPDLNATQEKNQTGIASQFLLIIWMPLHACFI